MAVSKLLFAVDKSVYAHKALDLVIMLGPGCQELNVIIVHVIESIPSLIGNPMRDRLKEEMHAEANKLMEPFREALKKAGITSTTRIEQGDIAAHLLQVAEKERCEMIVMGARGQSSVEEILLGSVSQKVLQHAKVPVLIAR